MDSAAWYATISSTICSVGDVFIFLNRRRDRITAGGSSGAKLLVWDRDGFIVWYKALERGTYELPGGVESSSLELAWTDLQLLLEGIEIKSVIRRPRSSSAAKKVSKSSLNQGGFCIFIPLETMISIAKYETLQQQNTALRHELDQLKRLIFGVKSERLVPTVPPEQMALWGDADQAASTAPAYEEQISYSRKKKRKSHPGRIPLPDHLPVEEIILEPAEDTTGLECIGREVTNTLDYRPGKLVILRPD